MTADQATRFVAPADLTNAEIAEARRALEDLAKILGRASAEACHKLSISFDMDDPQVARDVLSATFEALVYSKPGPSRLSTKRNKPAL